jgi:hypothetical protein
MPAQPAVNLLFNIPAHIVHSYNIHKSYRRGYFGIPGVISPTLAPEAVGDSQSRAQASTKYTKVPTSYTHKTYMLAFMGNLRILLCPLWLYRYFVSWAICLLGYSASWAILPLGLLCLLGLPLGLLCLLSLPLGLLCLLGLPLGLFQHVATWAMSHRHCLLWQCRYTDMPLGLCHHWALVSMSKW